MAGTKSSKEAVREGSADGADDADEEDATSSSTQNFLGAPLGVIRVICGSLVVKQWKAKEGIPPVPIRGLLREPCETLRPTDLGARTWPENLSTENKARILRWSRNMPR